MQYREITPLSRHEAEAAAERADAEELTVVVLAVAFHEDDPEFAQRFCLRFAQHPNPRVRANSILGFGHLARRFESLDVAEIVPIVKAALSDPERSVRGQAHSAADDLQHFLGLEFGV